MDPTTQACPGILFPLLTKVDRGEWPKSRLLDMMGQTLSRPDDRALFGLDSKAEDAREEPAPAPVQTV